MTGNETAIVFQVLDLIKGTNIGNFTNQVLLTFGGIASVTIIYFLVMIYYQSQVNKRLKEQKSDMDLMIILLNDQRKKLEDLHKLLIVEDTNKINGEGEGKKIKENVNMGADNINNNHNNNGFFNLNKK